MSVKVNVSDISSKIEKQIKRSVEISVDDKLAQETADQIKTRTRLGFGVDENGKQVKLKPLSDSYRAQRSGDAVFYTDENGNIRVFEPETAPYLSPYTTPAKSNLTRTNQMLESLKGKAQGGVMFISVTGLRDDGYTNREIADFVQEQGRNFLDLTNAEKNELARKLKNLVVRNL